MERREREREREIADADRLVSPDSAIAST